MAEKGSNQRQTISIESRSLGADAFGALTDALSNRLGQDPEFANTLQKIVDQTNIRFDSKKNPELLSEKLLGTWVGLAAQYTLLDAKKMPNEADGARWIQLESEVGRLEDAIGFAHRGSKKIVVDERLISIIADPTGDTQKRIADSLDGVSKAAARTTVKILPVIVIGEMLFSACSPVNPTTPPVLEKTSTVELMPALITKDYAMDMSLDSDFSNMDVSDKKSAEEIMTSLKTIYQESFPETDIANVTGSYVHIKTVSGFDWEVAVSSPYASLSDGGQTALIAFRENGMVKQAHVLWTPDERQTDGTRASTLRILELQGQTLVGGNLVFGISERETGGGLIVIANPDNPGDFQVFTTTETSQPNDFLDAFNLLPGSVLAAGEPTPIRLTPTPVFLATQTLIPTETTIPTETATPTEAPLVYNHGYPADINDFTFMETEADLAAVQQDIMNTPQLDINAPPMTVGGPVFGDGRIRFAVICDVGINCLLRASISKNIEGVGDVRETLWEGIRDVDGHNERIYYSLTQQDIMGIDKYEIKGYSFFEGAKHFTYYLFIKATADSNTINPVFIYLANQAGEEAMQRFQRGGNILDIIFPAFLIDASQ